MARRAGLYLRISKDLHDGAGVERQREDGERLIAQRGWELHQVYVDNDISAAGRKRRPGYQQLLADLSSGEIDAVVSRSFERLCKTRREQLTFVELGQERRAPVIFTHAPDLDLTTAVGRGMADMMAAWARVEMEQKSERHVDQIAQAARRGRMVGGRRAFGYTPDGLELDLGEAPLVVQMYERWLTGEGMAGIARWLNEQGVPTTQGGAWRYATVREVLANPRNAGLRGMRDVVDRRTGTRSQWHRIVGPAVWPGIVSEQTWQAALARIKDPSRPGAHTGRSALTHLLTGIARCGAEVVDPAEQSGLRRCDRPLVSGWRSGHRLLRCPSLRHISRRADAIEDFVQQSLLLRLRRKDAPPLGGVSDSGVDIEAIRAQAIEQRARLKGLAADYADGVLGRDEVRFARQRIVARLAELDAQVAVAGEVDVLAPLRAAEDPGVAWQGFSLVERRESIRRAMVVHVLRGYSGRPRGERFWPETVSIAWREAV